MTYLSNEIANIKKHNRFGLLKLSEHGSKRIKERGFDIYSILELISYKYTTIVQHHPPFTYDNNKDDVFVLYGKTRINNKPQPVHIVIAKEGNGYKIMTAYIPEKKYFVHHGRHVRKH